MRFFADLSGAFRVGVLGASTSGRKWRRWIGLLVLWAAAATYVVLAVLVFCSGLLLPGVTFVTLSVTLVLLSIQLIYTASSIEWGAL